MKLPVTFARIINLLFVLALSSWAHAAPVTYTIDPQHTYPSFESSHMGISTWRGKFDTSSGTVTLDRDSGDGKVDIIVDLKSVDFGNKLLNQTMAGPESFNTAKFPRATYKGRLTGFVDGAPSSVVGELTLHGVSKPLVLKINSFTCVLNQMIKPERCGADAFATFNRDDWNLDAGKSYGFPMQVVLRIQVEAVKDELPE